MRSLWTVSALLFSGLAFSACQPSSYVLVQFDGVPEAARSVKILVQRGSRVSMPLIPLALPNSETAGLSFRLDLPADGDDSLPVDIQVGAFSRAGGEGCLLASGGVRTQPRETAAVRLATVASLETCIEGDVVVQSVSPSLIATDQLASNELVLRGWGFQPGTQVRIDDQPVARLTFVSATEVRVVPVAAKRVGPQPISAQNQGSVRIAADLLRYYANQVTYTSMPVTSWNDFGFATTPTAFSGTALVNIDSAGPRFAMLRSDSSTQATWDLQYGYRFFGMSPPSRGGAIQLTPSLFAEQLKFPTQVLTGPFDIEPIEDIAVLDTRRTDGGAASKVGFRASIAGDLAYVYCMNFQDKNARIAAIAKRYYPGKLVADLALAFDDGTIGVISGTPRGIFLGPLTKTENQCERHLSLPAGTITSVQAMQYLRLPPMGIDNYLLVANLGTALYLVPPYDSSTSPGNSEATYNHTPYLLADMTANPVSQVITDDLDRDGLTDLIVLYRRNNQAFLRLNRGLPVATINLRQIAQFDTSIADFPISSDCAQAAPLRLGDINDDLYQDILVGCSNSDGSRTIEALLSRGSPIQFGATAQTVFVAPKSSDGGAIYFERMAPDKTQPVELWGGSGLTPLRLINTSH